MIKHALLILAALLVSRSSGSVEGDPDNGGISLPTGFCAIVFADEVGVTRHLAVARNGDVYVNLEATDRPNPSNTQLRGPRARGALLMLRDTTGDGRADVEVRLPHTGGTGVALGNQYGVRVPRNRRTALCRRRRQDRPGGLT